MNAKTEPALTSMYVTEGFYERLVANFADWQDEGRVIDDPTLLEACRAFLHREARLLDQHLYEDWLGLFADECLYWLPATPEGGDPRREVTVSFDDRRRLEDRIFRLGTGYAWSQIPVSRTVRLITNVEVFASDEDEVFMVRSNFLINELRAGEGRTLAGWCAHRMRRTGAGLKIEVRQANLIECDRNLLNPSIII
jgi:benzoate/toluate 1,2-dioxygenase beta subunit